MSLFTRRLGAFAVTSALAVSGLGLIAAPAGAVVPTPAASGANWLSTQLTSGLIHNDKYNFDDYGLSIDTAFALNAIGGHPSDVSAIETAVHNHIASYTTGVDFLHPAEIYAGPTAKALVLSQLGGGAGDPALVTQLEGRVASSAPIAGRIQDALDPTDQFDADFANTIGQAYAENGLSAASSTKAPAVLNFLLKQQCAAGYFRLSFADPTATDQTCDATGGPADPDVTSTVIVALLGQIDSSTQVARAVGKAEAWLLAQQHADGSFSGGSSTSSPNANSTGLAGTALGELGDTTAAQHAAVWVVQHQVDELGQCASQHLSADTGAIAYDNSALANGRAVGITTDSQDQWRRATSQGLLVLQWAPTGTSAVALTGPSGYVEAGHKATYHVSGVVPGHAVCVSGIAIAMPGAAGIDGTATVTVTIPPGTATRTISATDGTTSASVQTKSLGAAILHVKPAASRVKRGKTVRVSVSGLAAGEKVTLRLRGRVVASGTATSAGTFSRVIHVGRALGKARLTADGQFADLRHGSTTIRVVR